MGFKSIIGAVCACIMTISFSSISEASLIGDTVNASGLLLGPASATISNDIEFTGIRNHISFDFDENTLTLAGGTVSWTAYDYYVFSGFDTEITGLSISTNIGFTGDLLNSFSFTSDSITINMTSGQALENASLLVYSIETATVPIPSAVWLFGSGLIGLTGLARRKA